MAKLIGPCHSLDARGSLGKTLTFAKQRGSNYVKRYAVPDNPKTAAQTGHRAGVGYIAKNWARVAAWPARNLEDRRPLWQPLADTWNTTLYHAYLRYNQARWKLGLPCVNTPDPSTRLITSGINAYYYPADLYGEGPPGTFSLTFVVDHEQNPEWRRYPGTIQIAYCEAAAEPTRLQTAYLPITDTFTEASNYFTITALGLTLAPPFPYTLRARVWLPDGATTVWSDPYQTEE